MSLLDPAHAPAEPWRNGAGTTRVLAVRTDVADNVVWRISVADINQESDFSLFPEFDRYFLALGPVDLDIDGTHSSLGAGDLCSFPGNVPVRATVSSPVQAVNVMVRHGTGRARMCARPPEEHDPLATVGITLPGQVIDIYIEPEPAEAPA